MDIKFYTNDQINKPAWDAHIAQCDAGLIYARSVYLDHMSPGWAALIDETSQSIMPLPVKKKMNITYAWQPPFTQQLGIFSKQKLTQPVIQAFLDQASQICQSVNLYLNYTNRTDHVKERHNYILDLNSSFEQISLKFRQSLLGTVRKQSHQYVKAKPDEMFYFYKKYILPKNQKLSASYLRQFEKLINHFHDIGHALVRKIISEEGESLSIALFLIDAKRVYYMMSASTPAGRAAEANALLLYEIIREHSGSQLIFDFEGSEIPGVKFFFEKFGPVNQPYFHYESNRLNPILKAARMMREKLR